MLRNGLGGRFRVDLFWQREQHVGIAGYLVGFLVFLGFFGYLFLMIYYPEWVGITSKRERDRIAKDHSESTKE
jgi:hypothetical protein